MFYGSVRKLLRLLNRVAKQEIKKYSKPIKYESLTRIIHSELMELLQDHQAEQCSSKIFINLGLKQELLLSAQSLALDEEPSTGQIVKLIKDLHAYNISTRCHSMRKGRKKYSKGK